MTVRTVLQVEMVVESIAVGDALPMAWRCPAGAQMDSDTPEQNEFRTELFTNAVLG